MATDPTMLTDWYSSYMSEAPKPAATATAGTATTTDWKPDENATVAGQLNKITAAGSPLIDQAQTAAKQQAAKRGMLNSTMAITAGQDAAYRTALPIAQQDASTFAQAGQFNAGAKNTASLNNASMLTNTNQFNASAANNLQSQQNSAGVSTYQQQQNINAQNQQQIRDIEAQAAAQGRALTAQETAQIRDIEAAAQRQQAGFGQERAILSQQFDQQRQMLTAQTDEQLRLLDAQNGTKLADSYRQTSQNTYDAYITDVQRIQESDMEPDVKAAQIENLQGLYQTRQEYINTIYAFSPGWSTEWNQFAVEFGEATPTGG